MTTGICCLHSWLYFCLPAVHNFPADCSFLSHWPYAVFLEEVTVSISLSVFFHLIKMDELVARDFSGGPVIKELPANVGNAGSIPGPGRFHMPKSNWTVYHNCQACALESMSHTEPIDCNYWSPCALESMLWIKRSHHNEKPTHHN